MRATSTSGSNWLCQCSESDGTSIYGILINTVYIHRMQLLDLYPKFCKQALHHALTCISKKHVGYLMLRDTLNSKEWTISLPSPTSRSNISEPSLSIQYRSPDLHFVPNLTNPCLCAMLSTFIQVTLHIFLPRIIQLN